MLRDEFLEPLGLSQAEVARAIGVPYQRFNEVVRGARGVTPSTALRLARYFGNSAQFWLSLQAAYDLWHASRQEVEALREIAPLQAA